MEVTLLEKERDLLLDLQVQNLDNFVTKKNSLKGTVNLITDYPVINGLVDRLSHQYYFHTGLQYEVRLHKYVDNINIPEHVDKTLFSLVYQYNNIPGFQYFCDNKWINFDYNPDKILFCFDVKSKHYDYEPVPHRFNNDDEILRYSLTIHVDDLDIR